MDLLNSEDQYSPWNPVAPLCVYNPDHIWDRACACPGVTLARHRRPICDLSRIIATPQLHAFTVPSTHYVSHNCIYVRSHLFAGTDSIAIDLKTMKDWLFSQHRPPAPRHQQSCHFFLLAVVIAGDCAMTLAFHVLQKICRIKNIITIYFHIWTQYNPIFGIFRACRGISIKY